MNEKRRFFSLRNKLLCCFLGFSSIPVIGLAYWTWQILDEHAERVTLESLRGIARAKYQAIEGFSSDRVSEVEKYSSLSEIIVNLQKIVKSATYKKEVKNDPPRVALEKEGGELPKTVEEKRESKPKVLPQPESPPDEGKKIAPIAFDSKLNTEEANKLRKALNVILADQRQFEELLVIDPKGTVVVSTFQGHEQKTAEEVEYFETGLKATYFQHIFISSITEKLTMVIATPIKTELGAVLGVLVARLNLDVFFKLVGDVSGLGQSGETVVGKEIGENIVFMAPTRHNHKAALKEKIPIGTGKFTALEEAARGQRGSGATKDYRSVATLAAWEHLPSLNWGILVKIDRKEALKSFTEAQYKSMLLTIVIVFLSVLLSTLVSGTLVKPLRELKETTDRISKGDMNINLSIRSNDEIGELANSFERMVASIKFLMDLKKSKDLDE